MEEENASRCETRSRVSASNTSSRRSSTSSAAARARAHAEAAKARLKFASKEMELKLQKAQVEASIEMLAIEKEAAAAVAKAEALEAVTGNSDGKYSGCTPLLSQCIDPVERTREYLKEQNNMLKDKQPAPQNELITLDETEEPHIGTTTLPAVHATHLNATSDLSPTAKAYVPNTQLLSPTPLKSSNPFRTTDDKYYQPKRSTDSHMTDFVRFLARRELVTTGLLQFNDQPESYRAWRKSFCNAVRDLDVTCDEEMDLLVKWLGKESSEHAKRIRSIHINRPDLGLEMIWKRLDDCYGSPEAIEKALFQKLDSFPKLNTRDYSKLRDLGDLLMEVNAAKMDGDLPGLSYLDTPRGINAIVQKLPYGLQERWLFHGSTHKEMFQVSFPPFSVFVNFIHHQAQIRNDPSFNIVQADTQKVEKPPWKSNKMKTVSSYKTDISTAQGSTLDKVKRNEEDPDKICPIHKKPHTLQRCRGFRLKPLEERKSFLKENGFCFKCCNTTTHTAKNCQSNVKCTECGSEKHVSALHPGLPPWASKDNPSSEQGGEQDTAAPTEVMTNCTTVCGKGHSALSCSKICLAKIYPSGQQDKAVKVYVILDEQSNRSLVRPEFFDMFNVQGLLSSYTLMTCTGLTKNIGRTASGFYIESLDGETVQPLPTLLECAEIPDNRAEIPTPNAAVHHIHLKRIAHLIPELDAQAPILLLLGRDAISLLKVRENINGPPDAPYAQRLDLGWVLVGNVCLRGGHKPTSVNTLFTNALQQGRPTIFEPCSSVVRVKEEHSFKDIRDIQNENHSCLGQTVFQLTKDDNKPTLSIEDRAFLTTMEQGIVKNNSNSWVAPLPFRHPRPRLPDNRQLALKRFTSLKMNLLRKPEMKEHFFTFMEKIFQNGHAEVAPPLQEHEERWYLPLFGVYHPRKLNNIRVVFDSSAQYEGLSLNDVLLTGPDLNNALVGVLIRFRKESIAVTADIKQMFHCFLVRENDRNFLRFFWFKNNDLNQEVIEYRMTVHVFGNSPSPAVAIYCLRQSAAEETPHHDPEVKQFVDRDFYVDDGLKSLPTAESAISLIKRTQDVLANSNLRLHKIASNSKTVMEAFPPEDRASDLKDLDLGLDTPPLQRSLGLNWDLKTDTFTFKVDTEEKPFTQRGVLSVVNSVYDPLGFAAPVTIQGKHILRELTQEKCEWDSPLPQEMEDKWKSWRDSLQDLRDLQVPRPYTSISPATAERKELCVYCDASTKAIAAVVYLKLTDNIGHIHAGFVMGKAKLAPKPEHTIPRLELCAAVLAVELAELVTSELDFDIDTTTFYTDSTVVLGYIYNETRRFYVYVSNRVLRIRRSSSPSQWKYIPSDQNPADSATRSVAAAQLKDTSWLIGPPSLYKPPKPQDLKLYELISPSTDPDVRAQVSTLKTQTAVEQLGSHRFTKFSSWSSLRSAIAHLRHIAQSYCSSLVTKHQNCKRWHLCKNAYTAENLQESEKVMIRSVQEETYAEELACLQKNMKLSRNSPLRFLDPFIDADNLLRVGGRIRHGELQTEEKNPILIPGKHHIAVLLVRYFHEQTLHQGRLFTEGAIRAAGYWITGVKKCVSSLIHHCVTCRKLRGSPIIQKMADLPADRLSLEPPFTNVGLDVFGPWSVEARRTRGGLAHSKRWAVIFTCMTVRAVHIEVIESLDTSSFINALRRFFAIRGPVKLIRSDRGTNFIGASAELKIPSNIDATTVNKYLAEKGCSWTFNPPHASHMGGSWERMIGIARRILDSMFHQLGCTKVTHEVLTTLMAEVAAIINARPLVSVSTDPTDPILLTPSTLLTQKTSIPSAPPEDSAVKDLHKQQWRQVQHLAQTFWNRWRKQFLSVLQPRRKWQTREPNLEQGSVVLLKDQRLKRNEWPLGIVTQVFPSKDSMVRKAEVRVFRGDGPKMLLRPLSELVLLIAP